MLLRFPDTAMQWYSLSLDAPQQVMHLLSSCMKLSTLNINPAMVVPVFVKPGGLTPLFSRYAFRPHRSNEKPPFAMFDKQCPYATYRIHC